MNGIGDFIASTKEVKRIAAQVIAELKGDLPGHEFRGNQYSEGGGSGGGDGGSSGSGSGEGETISKGFTRGNYMETQREVVKLGKEQLSKNLPDGFTMQEDGRAIWKKETDMRKSMVSIRVVDNSTVDTVSANFSVDYSSTKLDPSVGRFTSVRGPGAAKVFSTLRDAKREALNSVKIEEDRLQKS